MICKAVTKPVRMIYLIGIYIPMPITCAGQVTHEYLQIFKQQFMGKYKLALGKSEDGRKEIFVLDQEKKTIFHCWEQEPVNYNPTPFSPWKWFGGHDIQDIAVESLNDKSLLLGAIGGDGKVYLRKQIIPNGGWGEWICFEGFPVNDYLSTSIAIKNCSRDNWDWISIMTTNENNDPDCIMEAFVWVRDNQLVWLPRHPGYGTVEPMWIKHLSNPGSLQF